MVKFIDKKEKVDYELFELAYNAALGWLNLFFKSKDILREMEARKIIPHDLWLKAHKICETDGLPKKYQKGAKI